MSRDFGLENGDFDPDPESLETEVRDDFQRLIDVLVLLRFERQLVGSDTTALGELMDTLITQLVAVEKERTSGAPTVYAELAKRILHAETSWTGRRHGAQSRQEAGTGQPQNGAQR